MVMVLFSSSCNMLMGGIDVWYVIVSDPSGILVKLVASGGKKLNGSDQYIIVSNL